jgi:hypothetical protein
VLIGPRTLAALLTLVTFVTIVAIWLAWFIFSRGVFTQAKCPRCASERIRTSSTSNWQDQVAKLFLGIPYRCEGCGLRHYNARWVRLDRPARDGKRAIVATE